MQLLKIDGTPISKFIKYEVMYAKLWAEDTGRVISGKMEGSLIGIFPKIQIEIGSCTEAEIATNLALFNKAFVTVDYYSPVKKRVVQEQFYSNDVTTSLRRQHDLRFNSYAVNLIAVRRMT